MTNYSLVSLRLSNDNEVELEIFSKAEKKVVKGTCFVEFSEFVGIKEISENLMYRVYFERLPLKLIISSVTSFYEAKMKYEDEQYEIFQEPLTEDIQIHTTLKGEKKILSKSNKPFDMK